MTAMAANVQLSWCRVQLPAALADSWQQLCRRQPHYGGRSPGLARSQPGSPGVLAATWRL